MSTTAAATAISPVNSLYKLGRPDALREAGFAACRDLGFTGEHIPQLIELALKWADDDWCWDDETRLYAPLHACYALGELRAIDAIAPLVSIPNTLDRRDDDWFLDEFPYVFGKIGAPAIEPMRAFLDDDSNETWARACCASALTRIAEAIPETRFEIIRMAEAMLTRARSRTIEVNTSIAGILIELKAREAADTLKAVFLGGWIDEMMFGDWPAVEYDLGLTTVAPRPRRCHHDDIFSPTVVRSNLPLRPPAEQAKRREKRKRRRQSRKRGHGKS